MENRFIRVHSVKDIVISSLFIIVGIVLALFRLGVSADLASFIFVALGAFLFFVLKNNYKDIETGEIFSKSELYFAGDAKSMLVSALTSNPVHIESASIGKGNTMKLDIYHSEKNGKAYLFLYEYVPHRYEPTLDMLECDYNNVQHLLA